MKALSTLLALPLLTLAVACSSGAPAGPVGSSGAAVSGFPGCSGLYNKNPSPTGSYYATDFGCSSDPYFNDPGDTCGSAACIQSAYEEGVCTSGQSNADCQRTVNWYAVGGASYGCGARLQVTNPANGKSVVVMVLDNGPSCTVENDANYWVLDVSYPTIMYLFGSQEGWDDHALINAVVVSSSTPLGPTGSAAPPSSGGGGGGGGGSGSGAESCTVSSLGQSGVCISTSECAAMGDSTSTPGFCPGAADIQCCTANAAGTGSSSGGSGSGTNGSGNGGSGTNGSGNSGSGSNGGGTLCKTNGDCNPGSDGSGQMCVSGTCVDGCNADWECPGNTTCVSGQCQ